MGFFDQFTGKNTEMLVNEYTEIYGEILLGMNRKLISLERKIENLQFEAEKRDYRQSNNKLKKLMGNTNNIQVVSNQELINKIRQIETELELIAANIKSLEEQFIKVDETIKLEKEEFEQIFRNKISSIMEQLLNRGIVSPLN